MEETEGRAFHQRGIPQSLSIPSASKSSLGLSHLPSLERTCRSSSSFSSRCSTSEAGPTAPLDTVTASISYCADNDEKSDVSSVSSGESLEELPPRSIFSSYWRTNGGAPGSLRRVSTVAAAAGSDDDEDQDDGQSHSTNTYERTLCTQEDHNHISRTRQVGKPMSQPRRRIFSGLYRSAPELSLYASSTSGQLPADDSIMRKTQSTSALMRRPSCISRRSGRSTSDRSVSFSPQVKVVVFTTPTEQWASKGWSDYFV